VCSADEDAAPQLDVLVRAGCVSTFLDVVSGAGAERPEWERCRGELRAGDLLVVPSLDRLGGGLRDLVDIVVALGETGVGLRSLAEPFLDTTAGQGPAVAATFAVLAGYQAALLRERTRPGLRAARAGGRKGGRKPKMTPALTERAQRMYDSRRYSVREIADSCGVTPMTIYRNIRTSTPLESP
jgi:DNA invertase Pin-like site-specific DNA recombinase